MEFTAIQNQSHFRQTLCHRLTVWFFIALASASASIGIWQGVAIKSLKFNPGPTLLRPAGWPACRSTGLLPSSMVEVVPPWTPLAVRLCFYCPRIASASNTNSNWISFIPGAKNEIHSDSLHFFILTFFSSFEFWQISKIQIPSFEFCRISNFRIPSFELWRISKIRILNPISLMKVRVVESKTDCLQAADLCDRG
jgi:hypothetical protein